MQNKYLDKILAVDLAVDQIGVRVKIIKALETCSDYKANKER